MCVWGAPSRQFYLPRRIPKNAIFVWRGRVLDALNICAVNVPNGLVGAFAQIVSDILKKSKARALVTALWVFGRGRGWGR